MEGQCSTGQSPQWAVVPMEEESHKKIPPSFMGPGGQFTAALIEPVSLAILIQSTWLQPILKLILVKKDTNWN